jgi:para-nitrobenzyl esterase
LSGATVEGSGIDHFLGIRYAAAPIGNLRFHAPKEPINEDKIVAANVMPDICPQANHSHPLYTQAYTGNEDCLYLNVFRPADIEKGRQLPVMVWLR